MNASNSYCTELIIKHQKRFPLWVVLEVISFGDLCHLFKFLSHKGYFNKDISDILFQVHDFRNAAAHNHCLLRNLKPDDNIQPKQIISQYIGAIKEISDTERRNRLKTRFIYDFVTMIYLFNYFVTSEGMRSAGYKEIHDLFEGRMLKHKEYFENCLTVKNAYIFLMKVIDFYL